MRRQNYILRPINIADIQEDELLAIVESDWLRKARRLQNRRWRAIKQSELGHHR